MAKEIQLTQGKVAIVDDDDFEYLSQWKWQAGRQKNIGSFYAVRTDKGGGKKNTILMHRVVMKTPSNLQCDHIHHNTLDNRKSELRNCTRSENQRNRRGPTIKSVTGHLGVYAIKNVFEAGMKINNVYHRIGRFDNIDDAIQARKDFYEELVNG